MNIHEQTEKGFTEYDNWRYLKNESRMPVDNYIYSQIDIYKPIEKRLVALVVLLGNYYIVSFPNMSILKYINSDNKQRKGIVAMAAAGRYPEYCKKCYGAGKFDWISNATGPNHFESRYEFIRDKNVVLLYHKPNGEISKNNVWAPTEVYEGERICDYCLGTGIDFDVSYQFESTLKKSLVLYDIRRIMIC